MCVIIMKPNSDKNNAVILQNLPDTHRDKIKRLLLDSTCDSRVYTKEAIHTYQNIAYQCDVSVAAVRAVAASLKAEIQERDLAMEGEMRSVTLSAARMAVMQIAEKLENREIGAKELPVVYGILTDKFVALKGMDKAQGSITINGDVGELAGSILGLLQRAVDRSNAVDAVVIEDPQHLDN